MSNRPAPSRAFPLTFRLPVCLLNTLCPGGLSGLLDPHVTDEASLGVWKQGHWQTKLKKKKTFRVKVQSPSSWLEEARSCKLLLSCPCPSSAAGDPVPLTAPALTPPAQPSSPAAWVVFQQRESWGSHVIWRTLEATQSR